MRHPLHHAVRFMTITALLPVAATIGYAIRLRRFDFIIEVYKTTLLFIVLWLVYHIFIALHVFWLRLRNQLDCPEYFVQVMAYEYALVNFLMMIYSWFHVFDIRRMEMYAFDIYLSLSLPYKILAISFFVLLIVRINQRILRAYRLVRYANR